jgi:hypothetical protein
MVTNKMIIDRCRKIVEDFSLSDSDFSTKYHVSVEQARFAKEMRCTTTLEMIADDLEDEDKWQEEQKRLREEKEGQ